MAKKQKKNSNYQTEARRIAQEQAELQKEKDEAALKSRPHKPTATEKQRFKVKLTHVICFMMAIVLVITSATAAIYSILESTSSSSTSAADYIYPPLYVHDGVVYAVTSESVYGQPEGDSVEELTAVTTGDQNTYPTSEGTCNFGKKTVPFVDVDGTIYCKTSEGVYLKCSVFTSSSVSTSSDSDSDDETETSAEEESSSETESESESSSSDTSD